MKVILQPVREAGTETVVTKASVQTYIFCGQRDFEFRFLGASKL